MNVSIMVLKFVISLLYMTSVDENNISALRCKFFYAQRGIKWA